MQIGSLLDNRIKKDITYSYYQRGLNTPYFPDVQEETEKCECYGSDHGNLFFGIPVAWKDSVLLRGGIDIRFALAESVFVDHLVLEQGAGSGLASLEVLTLKSGKYQKIGSYLPETGKLVTGEVIKVPVGSYCENLVVRLNGACMPVCIKKLDIWGAWELENAVWPTPFSADYTDESFELNSCVCVQAVGADERFAAEYLCEKLQEKIGFAPVITEEDAGIRLQITTDTAMQQDAYRLEVTGTACVLEAAGRRGLLYAVEAMLQRLEGSRIRGCSIEDHAFLEFRGVHLALPPKDQIPFLKNVIKYVWIPMRYNAVIVEIAGAMKYDRFPEINQCWVEANEKYERGEWPKPPHYEFVTKDVWEKSEVRELCEYMEAYGLEVIPEVQTFAHAQYITMAYPELAERIAVKKPEGKVDLNEEDEMPSGFYHTAMCPLHPKYYDVVFGVLEDVLEAVQPKRYVHMGHDEIYIMGACSKCSQVPRGDLYANEVIRLNDYVKSRNLTMMIWSDMLQPRKHAAQTAINKLPKDIIMMDFVWYFYLDEDVEDKLLDQGYEVMLGNLYSSHFPRFEARSHRKGVTGAEVSTWVACNEQSYAYEGKMFDFVFSAEGMWNSEYRSDMRRTYHEIIRPLISEMRLRIGGLYCAGEERRIAIGGCRENIPFTIRDLAPYNEAVAAGINCPETEIPVDGYAEILTFLHATEGDCPRVMWKPSVKIGEYIICYEDGSCCTEEILYGLNIYKYCAPYGDRLTSPLFRHEGYIGTYYTLPEGGKTHNGEDYTLGKHYVRNPHPEKKIQTITLRHCGNTESDILLFAIGLCR